MGLFGIPCLTPRESRGRPKGRLLRVVGFEVHVQGSEITTLDMLAESTGGLGE
jgi:hypothetical protein